MKSNNPRLSLIMSVLVLGVLAGVGAVMSSRPKPSIQLLTSGSGKAFWKGNLVELGIAENPLGNMESWAKIKINYHLDFDDVESFSFSYLSINGSRTPHMTLELDTDHDGTGDFWVIQWTSPALTGWRMYNFDDWYVYPYVYGKPLVHKTLSQIQADIDGDVVAVKVLIGLWNHEDCCNVHIRNIRINEDVFITNGPSTI